MVQNSEIRTGCTGMSRIVSSQDCEIKLLRAEMTAADDFSRKSLIIELLPDEWIKKIDNKKQQNQNWDEFKKFVRKHVAEEERVRKEEQKAKEKENQLSKALEKQI